MDISLKAYYAYIKSTQTEITATKYKKGAEMLLSYVHSQGIKDFTKLPRGILQGFSVSMIDKDYSAATISLYMVGAQRYLTWCRDQGVDIPDLARPDKPKTRHRVKEILSREDLKAFFQGCNILDEPMRTALMLMPCCGLRSEEVANLSLNSIQRVAITMQDGTQKACLSLKVIGKRDKERYVPLLDEGHQILQQYLTGWRREKQGNRLFPSPMYADRNVTTHTIWIAISKVRKHTNLTMTPHSLRRTYATTLWRRGVADTTIAKILGHENLQTLYKHYLNMGAADLSAAVHNKGGTLLGDKK